jgi:hypothetical protein
MPEIAARWDRRDKGAFLWQKRPIDCGIKLRSRIRDTPVTGSRILGCQAFDGVIEVGPNDVAFRKWKSARPSKGIFSSAARVLLKTKVMSTVLLRLKTRTCLTSSALIRRLKSGTTAPLMLYGTVTR